MTREEMRKKFAGSNANPAPITQTDTESFADDWTEQEIYDALQRILKREWDRFKFLGWI